MIIDHTHPEYIKLRKKIGKGKYNGCYYYSKEIVENIIPRIKTKRDWNTVGRDVTGTHDGMIIFLHDNSTPWNYEWLHKYNDLVLICSSQYTADSVKYSGHIILLPMSIDTEYVKQFRVKKKTKDTCFVGNVWVKENIRSMTYPSVFIPDKVDFFSGLKREKLLKKLAKYRRAMCIDRCAQEAKVLGCELIPLDTRYSVDNVGVVLDNRIAAKMLQKELDKLDKGGNMAYDRRLMKRGNHYVIEEKFGDGDWVPLCETSTISEAKEILKNINVLEGEESQDE